MRKRNLSKGQVSILQNICILCLSLLAGFLLVTVFSYEADGNGTIPSLNTLLNSPQADESSQSSDLSGMAVPFNLVATSEHGRYGRMLVSSAERDQLHSSSLLLEALGSASSPVVVPEDQFQDALSQTSLCLDYLFPVPSSILAAWFGADFSADLEIRYLLISATSSESAKLYLWDGIGDIYCYGTAVEYPSLADLVLSFRRDDATASGDVAFAFEDPETYGHLSPYTVLSSEAATASVLTSALPDLASDVDSILSILDFNPHTIARYNLTNGIEVVEFPRTLRVYTDGSIQYSGSADATSSLYVIPTAGESPSEAEALLASLRLAELLLPEEVLLDSDFYFSGIQPTDTGYHITFDYLIDGIPVYLASGASALEIDTTGGTITSFRLQYRQYTVQEDSYHLLPLPQAVHMATGYQNVFLTKGYVDRGGETVTAEWLVR